MKTKHIPSIILATASIPMLMTEDVVFLLTGVLMLVAAIWIPTPAPRQQD